MLWHFGRSNKSLNRSGHNKSGFLWHLICGKINVITPYYDLTPWKLPLVKTDRFWHEVFLSRIVKCKKKFRQHKIDHDLYQKQKKCWEALIPKFIRVQNHIWPVCIAKDLLRNGRNTSPNFSFCKLQLS